MDTSDAITWLSATDKDGDTPSHLAHSAASANDLVEYGFEASTLTCGLQSTWMCPSVFAILGGIGRTPCVIRQERGRLFAVVEMTQPVTKLSNCISIPSSPCHWSTYQPWRWVQGWTSFNAFLPGASTWLRRAVQPTSRKRRCASRHGFPLSRRCNKIIHHGAPMGVKSSL